MKLRNLQEAKYHNAPDRVAVHEVISSRGEPMSHHKAVVPLDKLIKYIEAAAAEDDDVLEDDEMDDIPWSIGAVLYNYKPQEIFDGMQAKRGWSGTHEEGAVGISTKGPAHAKSLALSAWADDTEDDEEDWY